MKTCGTCKWAKWSATTPTGRPKKDHWGTCVYDPKIVLPPLPNAMRTPVWDRSVIFPDRGDDCPCYERKVKI